MQARSASTESVQVIRFQGRNAAQIQQWLVDAFARLSALTCDEIDVDRAFIDYELDSSVAVTLTKQLGDWGGTELETTMFWEYPNIRELAAALASPPR